MSDKDILAELPHHKGRRATHHKDENLRHTTGPAKLTKERHNKREQARRESEFYMHSMKHKQRLSSAWAIDLSSDEQENVMELYKQALLDDHKTKLSETYPKEYSKIYTYEMDFDDDEYDLIEESPTSSPTQKSKFKRRKNKTRDSPETVKKKTTFSDSRTSHSPPSPPDNAPATDVENEGENEPPDNANSNPTENQSSLNLASNKTSPVPSSIYQQEEMNDASEDRAQELYNDSQENMFPDDKQVPDDQESNDVDDNLNTVCQDWDDRSSEPKDTWNDEYNRSCEPDLYSEELLEPKLLNEGSGLVYHPPNDAMLYGKLSCTYCTDVERDSSTYNDTLPYNCCNENKLSWHDHYYEPPQYPEVRNKSRTYLGYAETEIPYDVSLYSKPICPDVHTCQRHRQNSTTERAYETSCCCNDRLADINDNDNLFLDRQKVRRGDLFNKQTDNFTSAFSSDCDLPFCRRYNFKHHLSGAWRQNKCKYNCMGYRVPCSYASKKVVGPIEESAPDTYYSNEFNEQSSYRKHPDEYPADVMYSSCENRSNENPPPPLNQTNEYRQDVTFPSYQIESDHYNPGATYSTYDNPPSNYRQEVEYSSQPYNLYPDVVAPSYDNNPTSYVDSNWDDNVYFQGTQQEIDYYQDNSQNPQGQFDTQQAKWEPTPDPDPYVKEDCGHFPQQEPQSTYYGCRCRQAEATRSRVNDAPPVVENKCEVWNLDGCKTWTYGSMDPPQSSKDSHNRHKRSRSLHRSAESPKKRNSKIFKFILDARQKTVTCCLLPDNEHRTLC